MQEDTRGSSPLAHQTEILAFRQGEHFLSFFIYESSSHQSPDWSDLCLLHTHSQTVQAYCDLPNTTYIACPRHPLLFASSRGSYISSSLAERSACKQTRIVQVTSSFCYGTYNAGYCNICRTGAWGKLDLWKLPRKHSQDHKITLKDT